MFSLHKLFLPALVLGFFSLNTIASPAEVSRPEIKTTTQSPAKPLTSEQREAIKQRDWQRDKARLLRDKD